MSRYIQQRVHFISSSSEEDKNISNVGREAVANPSSKQPRKNKRRRPNRLTDNWKKVSPLKYLSTSSEEDAKDSISEKEKSVKLEENQKASASNSTTKNKVVVDTTRKDTPNKTSLAGSKKRRTQIF